MYVNNIVQISGFKSLATIISSNKHSRRKLAVYNNSQKEKDILRGTTKTKKLKGERAQVPAGIHKSK